LIFSLPFETVVVGDICNDGDDAVCGEVSEVISPEIE
jgi:hypothetical protein